MSFQPTHSPTPNTMTLREKRESKRGARIINTNPPPPLPARIQECTWGRSLRDGNRCDFRTFDGASPRRIPIQYGLVQIHEGVSLASNVFLLAKPTEEGSELRIMNLCLLPQFIRCSAEAFFGDLVRPADTSGLQHYISFEFGEIKLRKIGASIELVADKGQWILTRAYEAECVEC